MTAQALLLRKKSSGFPHLCRLRKFLKITKSKGEGKQRKKDWSASSSFVAAAVWLEGKSDRIFFFKKIPEKVSSEGWWKFELLINREDQKER
ncbi:hypothetical protein V6N12_059884 [Hibiscus sabdariffa]|uniref:Uncharacterized protein n=1 Tax=Hibiscus sabdariffa TaxID=183260 RepID=A0ABR2D377_9ROSI